MPGKRTAKVDRAKVEQARDSTMLRSLFYRGLHARTGQRRWADEALKNELSALRLQDQLYGKRVVRRAR